MCPHPDLLETDLSFAQALPLSWSVPLALLTQCGNFAAIYSCREHKPAAVHLFHRILGQPDLYQPRSVSTKKWPTARERPPVRPQPRSPQPTSDSTACLNQQPSVCGHRQHLRKYPVFRPGAKLCRLEAAQCSDPDERSHRILSGGAGGDQQHPAQPVPDRHIK